MATKTLSTKKKKRKKDVRKLIGRNSLDHILSQDGGKKSTLESIVRNLNPALKRLEALQDRNEMSPGTLETVVNTAKANWIPLGPLAVPDGQTYGGARVLISGRITSVVTHPTDGNIIYIGSARGGVWKSIDAGVNWTPQSDHEVSLAIGALAISKSNTNVLYAGTGEGNLQLYSSAYPLDSAPGIYLGLGILKSSDGGSTWTNQATTLLANHSFYQIAINPVNDQNVFAATSKGLCRTLNGSTWSVLGGLPAISTSIIACTDVVIDLNDSTGNTVYAAFWGSGIYKSTNALSANPTWTQATTGLPAGSTTSRISLAQSPSMPEKIFALIATSGDTFKAIYQTSDATGMVWSSIITSATIQLYGAFTCNIAVDPTTPNTVYVSGVELYKCVFSAGAWTVTNVGSNIHPDSHVLAFHPTNNSIVYSGNDGGIFKSSNGGMSWDDSINEGLCLLQYEAMDQHPASDVFMIGGTQDNGTQVYKNSPVFYHAADGDGGYCNISPVAPRNVIHSYYGANFERSTLGGKFGSWGNVSAGIDGNGLFYPPCAISPSSERMAVGTNRVNIDDTHGTSGWAGIGITLPGIIGRISALSFTSDTILYAGTTSGQCYRVELSGGTWTARTLNSSPLPTAWIWDIGSIPGNPNQIVVVLSAFGIQHVWRGTVPATGTATWVSISGAGVTALPDIPIYALAFRNANEFYVGTDVGVFNTLDGGATWNNFNQGMPNTAIYDLRFQTSSNLLRAATHGRGLWEIKIDTVPGTTSDLYFRDNLMHSGRSNSGPTQSAAFEDLKLQVNLLDVLYWWQSADIKVDSPNPGFQLTGPANYFDFDTRLEHRSPERGNMNRVYVQVHNRGPLPCADVKVKIMFANASAGLPDLPADFWTSFPNSAGDANWTPIGSPQNIAVLNPLKPEILEWSWRPPSSASAHTCMLVVMDSVNDPIPAASKVFDIGTLVTTEKRVGLKNLHIVNLLPDDPAIINFNFRNLRYEWSDFAIIKERIPKELILDLIFPKKLLDVILRNKRFTGFAVRKVDKKTKKKIVDYFKTTEFRTDAFIKSIETEFDLTLSLRMDPLSKVNIISKIALPKNGTPCLILISSPKPVKPRSSFTVLQTADRNKIIGGSTFVVLPKQKK